MTTTETTTETKTTYEIKHGQPNWHQARAGHAYAGTIVLTLTMPELAAFLAKIEARGEPHKVRRLAVITNQSAQA